MADTERQGGFIQTHTGIHFYPFDPKPEEITIGDIAHSLSLLNRFAGHTVHAYSVAQHSCYVAELVHERLKDDRAALAALLHDASEGLGLVDIPSPLKRLPEFAAYRQAEWKLQMAINERFHVKFKAWALHQDIKQADREMCCAEALQLMLVPPTWAGDVSVRVIHECFTPGQAERTFLKLFEVYGGKR